MTITDHVPTTATTEPWTRLLAILAAVMALWAAIVTLMAGPIPPVIVFGVLYLAGIFVLRSRPDKAGPIYLLVVSAAILAIGGPFAIEAVPHPESPIDFIFGSIQLVVPLAAGVAAVGALRRWSVRPRRTVAFGTLGLVVALAALSVAAALSLEDDVAAGDDVRFVAEDIEFAPDTLAAEAGTVGVFIDNEDPIRHTFVIDDLDVKLELPANTARRADFEAAPGTYEFFCDVAGHEDMVGVLTVTG